MNESRAEDVTIETLSIPVGDIRYEARLHYPERTRPERACVVAPPHPFLGGNFDNNVVTALANALTRSGYAVLTYNLPGVGKTSPRVAGAATREAFWDSNRSGEELPADAWDYLRLRDELLDTVQLEESDFHAAGYSYGGAILWEAAGLGYLGTLALVSPPESLLDQLRTQSAPGRALCLFAENDLAFGEKGPAAVESLKGEDLRMRVLEGADHFYRDHLEDVCCAVLEHFESSDAAANSLTSERP